LPLPDGRVNFSIVVSGNSISGFAVAESIPLDGDLLEHWEFGASYCTVIVTAPVSELAPDVPVTVMA
jgi:hypothetical protein